MPLALATSNFCSRGGAGGCTSQKEFSSLTRCTVDVTAARIGTQLMEVMRTDSSDSGDLRSMLVFISRDLTSDGDLSVSRTVLNPMDG